MPATIRAKEASRARGKRKSTLHRLILVSTWLLVPDHTEFLRILRLRRCAVSVKGLISGGVSAIKRGRARRSLHDCNSAT